MPAPTLKKAHCIGIGGIHVSAVAKLLNARGVFVSGSDAYENDETKNLRSRGIPIAIGHDVKNLPDDIDAVVYTHAVPEDNVELTEAKRRGIRCVDSHAFLAEMFEGTQQVVVTGSHGKSTTTAMLGLILAACGADPTVVVGTKCAGFADGNLRIGRPDLLVVEGDEYQRHVLSYAPTVLVVTNIDHDHVDVFPSWTSYVKLFLDLIANLKAGGRVVVNADDETCRVVGISSAHYTHEHALWVGREMADVKIGDISRANGAFSADLRLDGGTEFTLDLIVPGEMNVRNAAMALVGARAVDPGLNLAVAHDALAAFPGCWRRFERIGSIRGALAISDYGHHPTEIAETLAAARKAYPERRIVLVFQPHHRNRTRHLFNRFVHAFDGADALLLVEIYDVPGRESPDDANVSSVQLVDAVKKRDALMGKSRTVAFVPSVDEMAAAFDSIGITENDLVIFMGAGAIDATARRMVAPSK